MNRVPLNGYVALKTLDKSVMHLELEQKEGYDPFCLEYDATGTFKGKKICGKVFEYFPDDVPGLYYDLNRKKDTSINVGYLSEKLFSAGQNKFCEYFGFIKDAVAHDGNGVEVVFVCNNTSYAYIDEKLLVQIGADYKKDLLRFVEGSALLDENSFKINCSVIAQMADGRFIPCGAYSHIESAADLTDANIYSFGSAVFTFLFGRAPGIADCRFCSDWNKSEIVQDIEISDRDFDILKNLLRRTLQVTRRNCFSDFNEIRNEILKINK